MANGSTTITYNITMNYEGFLSGYTYKVKLSLDQNNGKLWLTSFSNVPIKYIKWTTTIDGKTIADFNITQVAVTSGAPTLGSHDIPDIGIAVKSTTPVVNFIITIPRPQLAPGADPLTAIPI
jgi:hypothetical protein